MKVRLVFAVTAILVLLGAPATLASAKDAQPSNLHIQMVDDTSGATGQVVFDYAGPSKDVAGTQVKVDGKSVKTGKPESLASSNIPQNVLFVVDASSAMGTPKQLAANRDALRNMITDLPKDTGVGVVSYGSQPTELATTGGSTFDAVDAIKDLGTNQGDQSVLWDATFKGITDLNTDANAMTSVVLITDGQDTGSKVGPARIRDGLTQLGAPLYVVALGQQGLDGSGLSEIVSTTGGQSVVVGSKADVAKGITELQNRLAQRYVVKVPFGSGSGQRDLELQVGSSTAEASFSSGAVTRGATALAPVAIAKPWGPSFLQTDLAKYLALIGIALALGLATYGIAHLVTKDSSSLSSVLRPYSDGTVPQDDEADDGALAQTAILQRAVQMTEEFAERQGFLANVESKLERADLPLRAAEAIFFWVAATVVLGLGSLALFGLVVGAILTVIVGIFPAAALSFLANRRRKAFDSQLPDMLGLLSGSLRAGYSLMQGMEAVAQEVTEPMGKELRRVCTEARLGRDLEEALDGVAERMGSRDFEWAVMAIRIQREVGGNLAELLLTVAETMTHRERLRREVAALTAEGKISAIVLGILPPGLGAFMFISNPDYMHGLITTTIGHILLGVALVAMIIGFVWMKKIIEIEI